jgi:hypothetical protein
MPNVRIVNEKMKPECLDSSKEIWLQGKGRNRVVTRGKRQLKVDEVFHCWLLEVEESCLVISSCEWKGSQSSTGLRIPEREERVGSGRAQRRGVGYNCLLYGRRQRWYNLASSTCLGVGSGVSSFHNASTFLFEVGGAIII